MAKDITQTWAFVGCPHDLYTQVIESPLQFAVLSEMIRLYDRKTLSVSKPNTHFEALMETSEKPIAEAIKGLMEKKIIIRTRKGHKTVSSRYNIPYMDQYFVDKGVAKKAPKQPYQSTMPKAAETNQDAIKYIAAWEKIMGMKVTQPLSINNKAKLADLLKTTTIDGYLSWYAETVADAGWPIANIAHSLADGMINLYRNRDTDEDAPSVDDAQPAKAVTKIQMPETITRSNVVQFFGAVDNALCDIDQFGNYLQDIKDRAKRMGLTGFANIKSTKDVIDKFGDWDGEKLIGLASTPETAEAIQKLSDRMDQYWAQVIA